MSYLIRVFCDAPNPRHPRKHPRVLVTTFNRLGTDRQDDPLTGRWGEFNSSPRVKRLLSGRGNNSGTTLTGDERYWVSEQGTSTGHPPTRSVYSLTCPTCQKPYEFREATMFAVLNEAHRVDESDLTLAQLSDIVQNMAQQQRA